MCSELIVSLPLQHRGGDPTVKLAVGDRQTYRGITGPSRGATVQLSRLMGAVNSGHAMANLLVFSCSSCQLHCSLH